MGRSLMSLAAKDPDGHEVQFGQLVAPGIERRRS
jgi:hypothetical protein